jgi:tetratricopeptide (TPR) repeat protein
MASFGKMTTECADQCMEVLNELHKGVKAYRNDEDYDRAQEHFREALRLLSNLESCALKNSSNSLTEANTTNNCSTSEFYLYPYYFRFVKRLKAITHIQLGRIIGLTGRLEDGLAELAKGLVIAEEQQDRQIQSEGYYVLGRIVLYNVRAHLAVQWQGKQLEATSQFQLLMQAALEVARYHCRQARSLYKPIMNGGESWASEIDELPIELGMNPFDIAWGLADSHTPKLRAAILHQKGRVEMELGNYRVAEQYLMECFRLADQHMLESPRLNAARALIHCWILLITDLATKDKMSKLWKSYIRKKAGYKNVLKIFLAATKNSNNTAGNGCALNRAKFLAKAWGCIAYNLMLNIPGIGEKTKFPKNISFIKTELIDSQPFNNKRAKEWSLYCGLARDFWRLCEILDGNHGKLKEVLNEQASLLSGWDYRREPLKGKNILLNWSVYPCQLEIEVELPVAKLEAYSQSSQRKDNKITSDFKVGAENLFKRVLRRTDRANKIAETNDPWDKWEIMKTKGATSKDQLHQKSQEIEVSESRQKLNIKPKSIRFLLVIHSHIYPLQLNPGHLYQEPPFWLRHRLLSEGLCPDTVIKSIKCSYIKTKD